MLVKRLQHVSFPIANLERSQEFYEGVLGLRPVPRPDMPIAGIWYGLGDSQLHLIVTPEGTDIGTRPARTNPLASHNAFTIDDYDKTVAYLKSKGVAVFETNAQMGQLWIRDPDGNTLELIVE